MTFVNGLRVVGVVALCLVISGGCARGKGRPTRVELTFDNVRTFTDPGGTRYDEWAAIQNIPTKFHMKDNPLGVAYAERSDQRPSAVPGMELRKYTVTMVVQGMGRLGEMDRELEKLADKPFGPSGERAQISPGVVGVPYSMAFVSSALEITLRGQASVGAKVLIYSQMGEAVQVPVAKDGSWMTRVGVGEGRYIYGTATLPDSPTTPRCFRIDVLTRKQEEIDPRSFESMRKREP